MDSDPTTTSVVGGARVHSVDLVRGLAMVVMVLDHAREFLHDDAYRFDPTDIGATTAPIFLTRWITHFVAPAFVLLAGVSVRLLLQTGRTRRELSRFLVVRGLWLVVLEFTIVRLGIWFNADPSFLGMLQVIWVIGVSMLALAGLIFLPDAGIALFGSALIIGHNAFDRVTPPEYAADIWTILHQRGDIVIGTAPEPNVIVLYPLVPWVGVLALGFVLGHVYTWAVSDRRRALLALGALITTGWLIVRATAIYGDPEPFRQSSDMLRTVISFLNAEKYPPSLIFLLMTLGPTILLLGVLEGKRPGRYTKWLATFGTVPLFFYILQWFAVHGLAVAMEFAAGRPIAWHFIAPPERFAHIPANAGFPLPVVYLAWTAVVLALYVPCRRYAQVRLRRGGVLRYL